MALSVFTLEENVSNRSGSRIIKCHGEKEIFIYFGGGNRTRIAGFVAGQSPSVLAGPGRTTIYNVYKKLIYKMNKRKEIIERWSKKIVFSEETLENVVLRFVLF